MSKSQILVKEQFLKELKKFQSSRSSFKEYYKSMKEMSDWLKEREK